MKKEFRNVESDGLKNKLKLVFQKEEDKNLEAIMDWINNKNM